MKNNTKVRLHLSKQLFESLAKQVINEAKKGDMSGGAYTEAVKLPKEKKEKKEKSLGEEIELTPLQKAAKDKREKEEAEKKKDRFNPSAVKTARSSDTNVTKSFHNQTLNHKAPFREMETMTAEKKEGEQINEIIASEGGLVQIGQTISDLLNLGITDPNELMKLAGYALTGGVTGAAGLGGVVAANAQKLKTLGSKLETGLGSAFSKFKNLAVSKLKAKNEGTVDEADDLSSVLDKIKL